MSDQLRLLRSLGHWVGDIHQPLHISFDDNRGNPVAIAGACKFNLRAVWDNCIIEIKIGLDYADIAAKLRAETTDEERARWVPLIIDTAAGLIRPGSCPITPSRLLGPGSRTAGIYFLGMHYLMHCIL